MNFRNLLALLIALSIGIPVLTGCDETVKEEKKVEVKDDGTVTDVVPGKTAHKSGVGPGMKVIAVNGRRWSAAGMRAGLAATKESGKVELIVENGEFFRNVAVPYRDGARYPRLECEGAGTDLIADIVRPRGEDARTQK